MVIHHLYGILRRALDNPETLSDPTWQGLLSWKLAAVPKRQTDEYRPIAVGSMILRAWLKAILHLLPGLPDRQFGGRSGCSVSQAIGDWLAHHGTVGAEIDLAKAFDNVSWDVAAAALTHAGVNPLVVSFLRRVWGAPRFCSLHGTLSQPFTPVRGIPQGDPTSPCILAQILSPWHAILERQCPGVMHWAFIDHRSIGADDHPTLQRALACTSQFDVAVGLKENLRKRQVWSLRDAVEHLGVVATASNVFQPVALRGGWQRIFDLFALLPRLPGGLRVREAAARCFIKPVWTWCLPYLEMPPPELTKHVMQALLCTTCAWWCRGRFFAERVDLRPQFGIALAAIAAACSTPASLGVIVRSAVASAVTSLCLRVVSWNGSVPILDAFDNTLEHRLLQPCRERVHDRWGIDPTSAKGQHGLRAVARLQCLRQAATTRNDVEGILEADVRASSHPVFVRWRASLSHFDKLLLRIFRSGAVMTPARRTRDASCPHCEAPNASMRHFWASCPRYAAHRDALSREYRIPPAWYLAQPRCTSKSGWITFSAAGSERRRAELQVLSCKLAVHIMQDTWGTFHAPPDRLVP